LGEYGIVIVSMTVLGANKEMLRLVRLGVDIEEVSKVTGIPVIAIKEVCESPMGRASIVRINDPT